MIKPKMARCTEEKAYVIKIKEKIIVETDIQEIHILTLSHIDFKITVQRRTQDGGMGGYGIHPSS